MMGTMTRLSNMTCQPKSCLKIEGRGICELPTSGLERWQLRTSFLPYQVGDPTWSQTSIQLFRSHVNVDLLLMRIVQNIKIKVTSFESNYIPIVRAVSLHHQSNILHQLCTPSQELVSLNYFQSSPRSQRSCTAAPC